MVFLNTKELIFGFQILDLKKLVSHLKCLYYFGKISNSFTVELFIFKSEYKFTGEQLKNNIQ